MGEQSLPRVETSWNDSSLVIADPAAVLQAAKAGKFCLYESAQDLPSGINTLHINADVNKPDNPPGLQLSANIGLTKPYKKRFAPVWTHAIGRAVRQKEYDGLTFERTPDSEYSLVIVGPDNRKVLAIYIPEDREVRVSSQYKWKKTEGLGYVPTAEQPEARLEQLTNFIRISDIALRMCMGAGFTRFSAFPRRHSRTYEIATPPPTEAAPSAKPKNKEKQPKKPIGIIDEPHVRFEELGGVDAAAEQLRNIAVLRRRPDISSQWATHAPRSVLMYGPEGSGKASLAEALAKELGGKIWRIFPGDINTRHSGASEENIYRMLQQARNFEEPRVLLVDGLSSYLHYGSDEWGVSGQFMQALQEVAEEAKNVIVAATSTEHPDDFTSSLNPLPYFDMVIQIPEPTVEQRFAICTKLLGRLYAGNGIDDLVLLFSSDVTAEAIAALTPGHTAASLHNLLHRALQTKAVEHVATGDRPGPVTMEDIQRVLQRK